MTESCDCDGVVMYDEQSRAHVVQRWADTSVIRLGCMRRVEVPSTDRCVDCLGPMLRVPGLMSCADCSVPRLLRALSHYPEEADGDR